MAEAKQADCADVIVVKAEPKGKPDVAKHFEIKKGEKLRELKDGEILISSEVISVDPYLRFVMNGAWAADHKQIDSYTVAKVLQSKNEKYKPGDHVYGQFKWSSKQIVDAKPIINTVPPNLSDYKPDDDDDGKFDVEKLKEIPLSYYVGAYGMPGQTAFLGLTKRGEIKKGSKVLISGAAGIVGSLVGQIAKNVFGCYVVGIAGSAEKIKFLTEELGFDAGINYKEHKDFKAATQALTEKFPDGIDFYWDNVGGVFTEAVFEVINTRGKILVCGQISTYNDDPENPRLIRPNFITVNSKELDIRGFLIFNWDQTSQEFYYKMGRWILEKKIKVKETVVNGFDKTPEAFCGLFAGKNMGKMVVKCSD